MSGKRIREKRAPSHRQASCCALGLYYGDM